MSSPATAKTSTAVPDEVTQVLKDTQVGYLTVISKKQELYTYPVAYHYSDLKVYFVTPVSAAKYKFIESNPTVSFIVDNKKLTLDASGALVQGKAKIFTIGKTIFSIREAMPQIRGFSKKYPGMLTFYARGKELPDERKIYKYRLIRIDPTKILYWQGYNFGRYIAPKIESKSKERRDPIAQPKAESEVGAAAQLLNAAGESKEGEDEELPLEQMPQDNEWLVKLDTAASEGIVSDQEKALISLYRGKGVNKESKKTSKGVSDAEKKLLRKLRKVDSN